MDSRQFVLMDYLRSKRGIQIRTEFEAASVGDSSLVAKPAVQANCGDSARLLARVARRFYAVIHSR